MRPGCADVSCRPPDLGTMLSVPCQPDAVAYSMRARVHNGRTFVGPWVMAPLQVRCCSRAQSLRCAGVTLPPPVTVTGCAVHTTGLQRTQPRPSPAAWLLCRRCPTWAVYSWAPLLGTSCASTATSSLSRQQQRRPLPAAGGGTCRPRTQQQQRRRGVLRVRSVARP